MERRLRSWLRTRQFGSRACREGQEISSGGAGNGLDRKTGWTRHLEGGSACTRNHCGAEDTISGQDVLDCVEGETPLQNMLWRFTHE